MFLHFWQKFENSKWPIFLGEENFLKIASSILLKYHVAENFDEIALSHTVQEIEGNWKI